jgi:GTPase SAR1 family protein
MLVGNKSDLSTKYRRVTYEQGSYFAHQNRCTFMEVSARKNSGIQEAFDALIKLWLNADSFTLKRSVGTKFEDKNTLKPFKNAGKKGNRDCIIM